MSLLDLYEPKWVHLHWPSAKWDNLMSKCLNMALTSKQTETFWVIPECKYFLLIFKNLDFIQIPIQ